MGWTEPRQDPVFIRPNLARRPELSHPPDLDQIFSRYVDPVYQYFYRRVGNRQDAEDLTSEVFLKASRQLDPQRAERSIGSWLFTVARTTLNDYWRRYYQTGAQLSLVESHPADAAGAAGDDPMDDAEQLVAEILAGLPERYRQVLELRFLRGYSIRETAAALALTPENVKVIQHRALAKAVMIAGDQA